MDHGSTISLPHSSTPPLYHRYITSLPSTQTPDWTFHNHNNMTSRHVKSFSLTITHSGNFRDIPMIEVSVEGGSPNKHCRKKRTRKEEHWSKYYDSPKKATILQITYITPTTKTPHYVIFNITPTTIRIQFMSCMLVIRIGQLPHKPFCLPTHMHLHQTPPQYSQKTQSVESPKNHRLQSISRILQHPLLQRPCTTPSKR